MPDVTFQDGYVTWSIIIVASVASASQDGASVM